MGMKIVVTLTMAFFAIPVVCGLAPAIGLPHVSVDIHVALVVFLGVACSGVRGILGAFVVGWLADLMTGHPTGLVICATLYAYVFARVRGAFSDIVSPVEFAFVCSAIDVIYGFSCKILSVLGGHSAAPTLAGVFLSALALAPASVLVFLPLSFFDRRSRRRSSKYEFNRF